MSTKPVSDEAMRRILKSHERLMMAYDKLRVAYKAAEELEELELVSEQSITINITINNPPGPAIVVPNDTNQGWVARDCNRTDDSPPTTVVINNPLATDFDPDACIEAMREELEGLRAERRALRDGAKAS